MENKDNKTKEIKNFNVKRFTTLIEGNPCYIATVSYENKPNIAVASDIHILDEKHILISQNEMIHTPENILNNKYVVLISFNDKWGWLRLSGIAFYYTEGKYMEVCNKLFNNETATPKGVIIVEITKVETLA